jgi:hypothetical protein
VGECLVALEIHPDEKTCKSKEATQARGYKACTLSLVSVARICYVLRGSCSKRGGFPLICYV